MSFTICYVFKQFPINFLICYSFICCNNQILNVLEYWCSTIYVDCDIKSYIDDNQPLTSFNLKNKVKSLNDKKSNNILMQFDGNKLNNNNIQIISNLSKILKDSGEIGTFEYDIFKIEIKSMQSYDSHLIKNEDFYNKFNLL